MNIAFDIDGVLTNIEKYQLEVAGKFYKEKYGKDIKNPEGFDVKEIFEIGQEEFMDFWTKHLLPYSIKELSRLGSSKYITKLKEEGNSIFIITSREFTDKDNILGVIMRRVVLWWLKKEGIPYDKIIFCSDDKTKAIKDNHIQVIVEDSPKNIAEIAAITDVICMDAQYNRFIEHSRVKHVSSMEEMYDAVNEIRNRVREEIKTAGEIKTGLPSKDLVHRKFYSEQQSQLFIPEETIFEFIYRINKDNMSNEALDYYGTKLTFKEFFAKIEECAKALKLKGIGKGDIVTICMPNTPEGVIAFYAVNKIGAVANMIHPLSSETEILRYLNEAESKIAIAIDTVYEKIDKIKDFTKLEHIIMVSPKESMPLPKKIGFTVLAFAKKHDLIKKLDELSANVGRKLKLSKESFSIVPGSIKKTMKSVNGADIVGEKYELWDSFIKSGKEYNGDTLGSFEKNEMAVLLHTGGSSGVSKGVMLSNENFNANTVQLKYTIPFYEAGDKLLAITPIFHGFGLADCVHTALGVNMSTILLPNYDQKSYTQAILKKPALVLGVPTLLNATIKNPKLQKIDAPFNLFISGGDHLFSEKEEEANHYLETHNAKSRVRKGYGMTECLAAVTFTGLGANKVGSVGIPLPLNKIKIINPTTKEELGFNQEGEICISGPTVMLGYYKNTEETQNTLFTDENGDVWLQSKDLGYIDEDGLLHYTGRAKRVIVSAGYNVYPQQIEQILASHPAIEQAVVVGSPDEYKVQLPKAFVTLKKGFSNNATIQQELYELCKTSLAKYAIPFEFEIVDSLPVTLYNKVDYKAMEELEKQKKKKLVK